MRTKEVRFEVTGVMTVPADATAEFAADNSIVGFTLKDGRHVKLLVALEVFNSEESESIIAATDTSMNQVGCGVFTYDRADFWL